MALPMGCMYDPITDKPVARILYDSYMNSMSSTDTSESTSGRKFAPSITAKRSEHLAQSEFTITINRKINAETTRGQTP